MRINVLISLSFACLVTGCASGPKYADPIPPTVKPVGQQNVPADLKEQKLLVEFEGSPTMTRVLRTALSSQGQPLALHPDESFYQVTFKGVFRSDGAVQAGPAQLGALFESSAPLKDGSSLATLTPGGAAGEIASQVLASSLMNAGYVNFAGTNILESVLKASGISGAINEKLFGNKHGICVARCDRFEYSRQMAFVEVKIKQGEATVSHFGRLAFTYQRDMVPQAVIQLALESAYGALAAGSSLEEPTPSKPYPITIPSIPLSKE